MNSRRLGLFGGSFDPIHNGHLAVAALVREHLGLSRIVFIPAGRPPHKRHTVHVAPEHRLAMLQLAVADIPEFTVDSGEIERCGPSYTIDTLEALAAEDPARELFFIVGSDNLREMLTWRRYRDILRLVTLCVVHRPGHSSRRPPEMADARIRHCPSPEWGVSSSMVRELLAGRHSCVGLLSVAVRDYVRAHGLYDG